MARRPELPGTTLATQYRKQIFKCIAQTFTVVVTKIIDQFQKIPQGFRVAVREKSILKNIPEKLWNIGIDIELQQRFTIKVQQFMSPGFRIKNFIPGKFFKLTAEK